jgi:hypothetical protein
MRMILLRILLWSPLSPVAEQLFRVPLGVLNYDCQAGE